jgi:xanthine/uracil/vitamin C permease (AzgA family)
MGLNAYFAYQVVGYHGSGPVSYKLALTAVFIEGFVFIGLSLLGMRQWLVRILPTSLKVASACGIGLFLALIGLSYSSGIGAVTGSTVTPTDLGGCPPEFIDATTGMCTGHKLQNPAVRRKIFFQVVWYTSCLKLIYSGTALDRLFRRHHNRYPDGLSLQVCNSHWHCLCHHYFLAVSNGTILQYAPG